LRAASQGKKSRSRGGVGRVGAGGGGGGGGEERRQTDRERSLLTINKRLKVVKYNALSGNTACGHMRPGPVSVGNEQYIPTLRLATRH
jgi:hypothetical protein